MRDLLLLSACIGIALWMFLIVIFAIRGGKVGVDGSSAPYSWQSCPGKFAAIVFCCFLVGCGFLAGAVLVGLKMWRGL
jgi:hypothetical protein